MPGCAGPRLSASSTPAGRRTTRRDSQRRRIRECGPDSRRTVVCGTCRRAAASNSEGLHLRTALMTQGQRNSRFAATARPVRAALSLFLLAFLVGLSAAQEPADPETGLPEGPPFAPSLKPEWLA